MPSSSERGAALAVALFALVVIGALVARTFFGGLVEQQSGRNLLYGSQAFAAADGSLREVLQATPARTLLTLPLGGPALDLGTLSIEPTLTVDRTVIRLSDNLFLIRAVGVRRDGGGGALASRGLGLLLHLVTDSLSGSVRPVPLRTRGWFQLY